MKVSNLKWSYAVVRTQVSAIICDGASAPHKCTHTHIHTRMRAHQHPQMVLESEESVPSM